MFNIFKKKNNIELDFSNVRNENVNNYIKDGILKVIYIISPSLFGGSEGRDNQIVVTPEAEREKQLIDEELYNFMNQGKSVKDFNVHFDYKNKSLVPSKIFITAKIDEQDYNKEINIW